MTAHPPLPADRAQDARIAEAPIGVAAIEFGDMTSPDRLFKLMLHFAAACSTAEELGYRVVIHEFRDECDGIAGFQADATREVAQTAIRNGGGHDE